MPVLTIDRILSVVVEVGVTLFVVEGLSLLVTSLPRQFPRVLRNSSQLDWAKGSRIIGVCNFTSQGKRLLKLFEPVVVLESEVETSRRDEVRSVSSPEHRQLRNNNAPKPPFSVSRKYTIKTRFCMQYKNKSDVFP